MSLGVTVGLRGHGKPRAKRQHETPQKPQRQTISRPHQTSLPTKGQKRTKRLRVQGGPPPFPSEGHGGEDLQGGVPGAGGAEGGVEADEVLGEA